MKWIGRRRSSNVEDRRGTSTGKMVMGGGVIGLVVLLISMFLGGDSEMLLDALQQSPTEASSTQPLTPEQQQMGEFVAVTLADTEQIWTLLFEQNGMHYEQPKLVLFSDAVTSGCGNASSGAGPFYCPADRKIYMDLSFFRDLQTRYNTKGGDFAIAYVVAHEVGHHIQTLLGTSQKVREMQKGMNATQANQLSVALELQADFYAGIWAHYNQKYNDVLEPGDIEEALSAANAVGDDALQKHHTGQVTPDSFTHGTSAQRMEWFMRGFESGDLQQGDTFKRLN